jgi:hypothetical protein
MLFKNLSVEVLSPLLQKMYAPFHKKVAHVLLLFLGGISAPPLNCANPLLTAVVKVTATTLKLWNCVRADAALSLVHAQMNVCCLHPIVVPVMQ